MHGGGHVDVVQRKRVARILAVLVIPVALATVVAAALLWPRGATPVGSLPLNATGVESVEGPVTSIGGVDDNGQVPVTMRVSGVDVQVHVPLETVANGLSVGDTIHALFNPAAIDSGTAYIFQDFERGSSMLVLLAIYVVVVLLVARWKGLMAILGLAASLAVVAVFLIPALTVSEHPVAVILTAASLMMFLSIYLAHGISIRTTTAVLGTGMGLVIMAAVAWWAIDANNLTGALSDEAITAMSELPGLKLQGVLLGGMILAGLGALNDVTITQVSTVWELHAANPSARRMTLVRQAMTVGRDHIASTVYTLAFAYVGSAITLLLAASLVDRPVIDLLQMGSVAEEIVGTLVASIGLVAAIPLTTAVAARLVQVAPAPRAEAVQAAGAHPSTAVGTPTQPANRAATVDIDRAAAADSTEE